MDVSVARREALSVAAAPAGAVLAGLFGALARVRRRRPLHPYGEVVEAVLHRGGPSGGTSWGTAWLDEPGEDHGLVRLSRSVGLPAMLPDVLGLAFTFRSGGRRHDLLLSTTGLGAVTRFVLTPARDRYGSNYTCLLPYLAPAGPVVLAAVPVPRRPRSFRLHAASPAGRWQPFGVLALGAVRHDDEASGLRFDPVVHPLPGLSWPSWVTRLREPSYAAARKVGEAVS